MRALSAMAIVAASVFRLPQPAVVVPPPREEWRKLIDALAPAGCTKASELSAEPHGFDVEGAVCGEGRPREVRVDKSFAVKK